MTAHAACRGHPRARRATARSRSSAPRTFRRTSGRRSRRRSGRATAEDSIWSGTADLGVELVSGRAIASLDLDAHDARPTTGASRTATSACCSRRAAGRGGCRSRTTSVVYFRTLADYRAAARAGRSRAARFVVIGGGFIGSELAAALADERLRA